MVLAFYVADSGPLSTTCTRQLRSYSDRWDELDREGVVLAIAKSSVESHKKFASKNGLRIPLLSDRNGAVVRAYGVAGPLGITRRSLFVIDRDGLVGWKHVDPTGITYRTATEVIERIRELSGAANLSGVVVGSR